MCSLRLSFVVVLLLCAGCKPDASGPAGPIDGAIAVSIATQGDSLDPDGYLVVVSRKAATGTEFTQSVGGVGELTFSSVVPGEHYVALEDLAQHCSLQDTTLATQRAAVVTAGETSRVAFSVVCSTKTPGRLRITVLTTFGRAQTYGDLLLRFPLLIDDQPAGWVPARGFIEFKQFPAGLHTVGLKPKNCTVAAVGDSPAGKTASIRMLPGGLAEVKFNVWCGP